MNAAALDLSMAAAVPVFLLNYLASTLTAFI